MPRCTRPSFEIPRRRIWYQLWHYHRYSRNRALSIIPFSSYWRSFHWKGKLWGRERLLAEATRDDDVADRVHTLLYCFPGAYNQFQPRPSATTQIRSRIARRPWWSSNSCWCSFYRRYIEGDQRVQFCCFYHWRTLHLAISRTLWSPRRIHGFCHPGSSFWAPPSSSDYLGTSRPYRQYLQMRSQELSPNVWNIWGAPGRSRTLAGSRFCYL